VTSIEKNSAINQLTACACEQDSGIQLLSSERLQGAPPFPGLISFDVGIKSLDVVIFLVFSPCVSCQLLRAKF